MNQADQQQRVEAILKPWLVEIQSEHGTGINDEKKRPFIEYQQATAAITTMLNEAYRKGYNDNARDCYCDSPGATEGVLAHHHLMDDGKSHDIRPDVAHLTGQQANEGRGE